jgi:hypothetical protein
MLMPEQFPVAQVGCSEQQTAVFCGHTVVAQTLPTFAGTDDQLAAGQSLVAH